MHLLFIGQNATTGTPNRNTGRLSNYGAYLKFDSKKERDGYYNELRSSSSSELYVKCGAKSGRLYSLGSTVKQYRDHLQHIPTTFYNETLDCWDEY